MEPALQVVARLKMAGEDKLFEELIEVLEAFWCDDCGFQDIPGMAMQADQVFLYCPDCNEDGMRPDPLPWKA